jgi:hypothetical protein
MKVEGEEAKLVGQWYWALDRTLKGDASEVWEDLQKNNICPPFEESLISFFYIVHVFSEKMYVFWSFCLRSQSTKVGLAPICTLPLGLEGTSIWQNNITKHMTMDLIGLKLYPYISPTFLSFCWCSKGPWIISIFIINSPNMCWPKHFKVIF